MKKIFLFFTIILLYGFILKAQVPNAFHYQAVVRDASGEIVANKLISLRISILSGSAVGEVVYAETFNQLSTNEFGIISVNVGGGAAVSGVFDQIDWSSNTYYLQVDIDIEGNENYQYMGSSQILAVPYALQALNVTNKDDADADPTNEIQTLSKSGNTVSLSNNGGSFIDEVDDNDNDPTNEIQDLSLNNNILVITNNPNATPISLSAYQGTNTDEQTLSTNIVGNIVELTIGGGTGGNTVSFALPDDFVSRQNGGTFLGNIFAPNLSGVNTGDMSNADVVNAYNAGFPDHFTTADRIKLNGIEDNATGDMTDAEIVAAYQSGYPNYFNSTDRAKLNSIETGATGDMTNAEIVAAYQAGYPNYFNSTDRTKLDRLNIANTFTVSGGHTVQLNSQGNTILTLPTTGTLATETYVQNNFLTSNLLDGRILVGENGSAIQLDARGDGQILIGNGNNLFSRPITGDITLSNMGNVTVNSIGGNSISLGGSFTTAVDNITLNADPAGSNVTLPVSGILVNQTYVNNQIAASNVLNSAQIFVGNSSNVATGVTLSGDGSLDNTGVLTISSIGGNLVNLGGNFSTGGNLIFNGAYNVQFTSSGSTNLTLPTSGTLANQTYVNNQIAASNVLNSAQIFVGNSSNVATGVTLSGDATLANDGTLTLANTGVTSGTYTSVTVDAKGRVTAGSNPTTLSEYGITDALSTSLTNGTILIGNGSNIADEVSIGGDATLANDGTLTVSSIGGNSISLGGAFTTAAALTFSGANTVQFTSTAATNLTLPTSGTLANQAYVDARTGTNITSVGTITTGVWNGSAITGTYLDLSNPGAIGNLNPNTGSFTTLSTIGDVNVGGSVNITDVLNLTPRATPPASPNVGDIYVGTDNHIYCYLNGGWVQLDN